jgi:GNAT superfamily N-acetyltransferase
MCSQIESKNILNELISRNAADDDIEEMDILCHRTFSSCIPRHKNISDYFVAIFDGIIVAFGHLDGKPIEYEKNMYIDCMNYMLDDFCVHPDYRRRGVGTFLANAIYNSVKYYKGYARIEFCISQDAYEFWRNALRCMFLRMQEVCNNVDCNCKRCNGDNSYELDTYNFHDRLVYSNECSHLCSVVKKDMS